MTGEEEKNTNYKDDETSQLETLWGEGFLSPGGAAEVSRILGGQSIEGCDLLDIGSGTGGVDIVLVREHGARTIVGIDIQSKLVEIANRRLSRLALGNQIKYQLVAPGPLPFSNETFDAVFSKDAIIHVSNKDHLYSEAFRVIRPEGRLFVSDWLRGDGVSFDSTVGKFTEASGHDFTMVSLGEIGEILRDIGFTEIELIDRRAWYVNEATAELERMRGPLQAELKEQIEFWEIMIEALNEGAIMPGHIRAIKPASFD